MNVRSVCFVFAVCLVVVSKAKRIAVAGTGPYRMVFRKFMNSTPEFSTSTGEMWAKIYVSHGRPQYFWGESYSKYDLSDDMRIRASLAKWENNEFKKNYFTFEFDRACTTAYQQAPTLISMFAGPGTCPLKAGQRIVKNDTRDITFPNFPTFFYGRWRLGIAIVRKGKIVGVIAYDGDAVPRV